MACPQTQFLLPKQALSASSQSSIPPFRRSSIGMGIITTTAIGTAADTSTATGTSAEIGTGTAIGIIAGVTGVDMAGAGTIAGVATTAGDHTANGMAGAGAAGVGDIGIMIGIVTVGIAGTGTEFLGPRLAALCIFRQRKVKGCVSPMLAAAHRDLTPSA